MIVLALLRAALALACLLGLGDRGPKQMLASETEPVAAERSERSRHAIELLREHLRALPPEERASHESHLEEFERLSPQSREKLLRRGRVLRERERALEVAEPAEVAPEEPEAVDERKGDGAARKEQRRRRLREKMRQLGSEVHSRLPEDLRRRLERAPQEQRRRLLEHIGQDRERFSRKAIEKMRHRLDLAPHEIQRLERLPVEERLQAMHELDKTWRGRRRR